MDHSELKYQHVIGIMSGTSLDGVDLAYCVFKEGECWSYEIRKAETIPYPEELKHQLSKAMTLSGYELALLHNELGRYFGTQVNEFMADFTEEVELIASHGHTVFHRPDLGMTLQIGSGADIAAICGKPTVCDFRTLDVALGGQGAPLVPIGDELLFGQYDICLNLGGISNLSFRADGQRKAYDISPCNIVLNQLARQLGQEYDADGNIAQSGCIDTLLLEKLNQLEYYQQAGTKSLGREWIDHNFFPILTCSALSIPDQMRTVCEHIAEQIATACNSVGGKTLLITGGGAHNHFLIDLIRQKFHGQVIIPDNKTIDFKEAIIFAFLGMLRANGMTNCLASVTGARKDSCGGAVFEAINMEATASRSRNNKNLLRDADGYDVSDCVPQSHVNNPKDAGNCSFPYFDINDVEMLRWSSKLPHWHQNNKYVFITFRLADSLPQKKMELLKDEKECWMKSHPKPWTEEVSKEYAKRFASKIDKWLDSGYGECLLKHPQNRKIVEEALFHFNNKHYHLKAFVVMPNHVHILLQLFNGHEMEKFLKSIKSYTAKKINEFEHRSGKVWFSESYDHLVRNEDNYKHILKYIYANNKDLAWIEDDYLPNGEDHLRDTDNNTSTICETQMATM